MGGDSNSDVSLERQLVVLREDNLRPYSDDGLRCGRSIRLAFAAADKNQNADQPSVIMH